MLLAKHEVFAAGKWVRFSQFVHDNITDQRRSGVIIMVVILLVLLVSPQITWESIAFVRFSEKTAGILIDQRTSNVAAISSLTLVVVGFILTNLSVKSKEVYAILFRKSYLYPTVYLILTVIAASICISTLRDTLAPFVFERLVVVITYISLFILLMIANLFRNIVLFANEQNINSMLHDDFLLEGKGRLKAQLLEYYSNQIYSNTLQEKGGKEKSVLDLLARMKWDPFTQMRRIDQKSEPVKIERFLNDVDLGYLENLVDELGKDGEVEFSKLRINDLHTVENSMLWLKDRELTAKEKKKLSKVFFYSKSNERKPEGPLILYFQKKLDETSAGSSHQKLSQVLQSICELYRMEMEVSTSYELPRITDGIDHEIWQAVRTVVKNGNVESLRAILGFFRDIVRISIEKRSLPHFNRYIFLPAFAYSYTSQINSKEQLKHDVYHEGRFLAIQLKEIIWFGIDSELDRTQGHEDKLQLMKFNLSAFECYSRFLYYVLRHSDLPVFENSMNEFYQISDVGESRFSLEWKLEDLIRRSPENLQEIQALKDHIEIVTMTSQYRRHVVIGIRYWSIFLFENRKISKDFARKILQRTNVQYNDPTDQIIDLMKFHKEDLRHYMGWEEWDCFERVSGEAYSMTTAHQWLISGFVVSQLVNPTFYAILDFATPAQFHTLSYLLDRVRDLRARYATDFEDLNEILQLKDQTEFDLRYDNLIKAFENLLVRCNKLRDEENLKIEIKDERIQEFQNGALEAWNKTSSIQSLFVNFDANGKREETVPVLKQNNFVHGGRYAFTSDESTAKKFLERGYAFARYVNSYFFNEVRKSECEKISSSTLLEGIEKGISMLVEASVEIKVIIVSSRHLLNREIRSSDKYIPQESVDEGKISTLHMGNFDGIPIFYCDTLNNENSFLIGDLKKFGSWVIDDAVEEDQRVKFEVVEVGAAEAESKYNSNVERYLRNEAGVEVTKEDAVLSLRNSVVLSSKMNVEMVVLDPKAMVMGKLMTDT